MDQSEHLSHKLVWSVVPNNPLPFEWPCTALTIAALAADLASTAPLTYVVAGTGAWASGPLGIDFDFAFDSLPHDGAVAGPPVDDGSGFFAGADAALR